MFLIFAYKKKLLFSNKQKRNCVVSKFYLQQIFQILFVLETLCPDPPLPPHGSYSNEGRFVYESVVTYYCDPGYLLNGCQKMTCLGTGEWSHPVPICTGKILSSNSLLKTKYSKLFFRHNKSVTLQMKKDSFS